MPTSSSSSCCAYRKFYCTIIFFIFFCISFLSVSHPCVCVCVWVYSVRHATSRLRIELIVFFTYLKDHRCQLQFKLLKAHRKSWAGNTVATANYSRMHAACCIYRGTERQSERANSNPFGFVKRQAQNDGFRSVLWRDFCSQSLNHYVRRRHVVIIRSCPPLQTHEHTHIRLF